MAKKDTVAQIKAANGTELDETKFNQTQLDALLVAAQKGDSGKAEFEQLLKGDEAASQTPAAQEQGTEKPKLKRPVTVQVNEKIAAYGGEFTDPDSKATIGKDPVTVEHTGFIAQKLRSEEIVEVQ